MTCLVFASDNHIGKGVGLYPGRLAEQERVWAETLAAAREHREQDPLLVHCGDLFDSRRPSPDVIVAAERPLFDHIFNEGGRPPLVIPGNHDRPAGDGQGGLEVLAEAGLIDLVSDPRVRTIGGFPVGLLPWTPVGWLQARNPSMSRAEVQAAAADLLVDVAADLRQQGARILVCHWSISGASLPSGLPVDGLAETVIPGDALAALGFDLVVAGHIHRAGEFRDRMMYVGSPMPLTFGEGDGQPHGYVTFEPDTGRWSFAPTVYTPFVTITLNDHASGIPVDGYAVRVKDTVAEGERPDLNQVRDTLLAAGAKTVVVDVTVERARRQKVDATLDDLDTPADQLHAWLLAQGADPDEAAALVERATPYLTAPVEVPA